MLRKLRIGFDLDNILNNLTETLIEVYNKDANDNLTMEQIVTYKIDSYTKPGYKISDYFKDPAIWMRVLPIPQSQEYLKILNDDYDVRIVSASHLGDMPIKYRWLKTYFSFLKRPQIWTVFDKDWVDLDILVDDCLDNHKNGKFYKIALQYPWNETEDANIHRATDFGEIFQLIKDFDRQRTAEYETKETKRRNEILESYNSITSNLSTSVSTRASL